MITGTASDPAPTLQHDQHRPANESGVLPRPLHPDPPYYSNRLETLNRGTTHPATTTGSFAAPRPHRFRPGSTLDGLPPSPARQKFVPHDPMPRARLPRRPRHSDTAGLPRPDPDSDGIRVTLAHAAVHGLARPAVTLGIATPIRPGPRARSRTRMAPEFAQATLLRPGRAQPLAAPAWTRTTTPNRPGATTPRYANCGRAEAPLGRYGVPVGAATT